MKINKMFTMLVALLMIVILFNTCFFVSTKAQETVKISNTSDKNYALIIQGTAIDLDFIPGDNKIIEDSFSNACLKAKSVFSRIDYNTKFLYKPLTRDNNPNTEDIMDIITNEIPEKLGDNKQVFIFIAAHGDSSGNLLIRWLQMYPMISVSDLDGWLDTMEGKCKPSRVTVVIESCHAGRHASGLAGSNRIIITSTDASNYAWVRKTDEGILQSFSIEFFNSLQMGKSYGQAWEDADAFIDGGEWSSSSQNPLINDNGGTSGSGTSLCDTLPFPSGDGQKALNTWPGRVSKSHSYAEKEHPTISLPFVRVINLLDELFQNLKVLKDKISVWS